LKKTLKDKLIEELKPKHIWELLNDKIVEDIKDVARRMNENKQAPWNNNKLSHYLDLNHIRKALYSQGIDITEEEVLDLFLEAGLNYE